MILSRYTGRPSAISRKNHRLSNFLNNRTIVSETMSKLPPIFSNSISNSEIEDTYEESPLIESKEVIPFFLNQNSEFEFEPLKYDEISLPKNYNSEFIQIYESKLKFCSSNIRCSWIEQDPNFNEKKKYLLDILNTLDLEYIIKEIDINLLIKTRKMVEKNIFRIYPQSLYSIFTPEEQPSIILPNKVIIDLSYSILHRLISIPKSKEIFPNKWHTSFTKTFNTPDVREHDPILHFLGQYFIVFPERREQLLQHFSNIIYSYRLYSENKFQIYPILLFLNRIYKSSSNFTVQQYLYFEKTLLPLLKTPHLFWFSIPLKQIIYLIVTKDKFRANYIIKFIIKHWPYLSINKQLIFTEIIILIREYFNDIKLLPNLFKILGNLSNSHSNKIAETSYLFWIDFKLKIPLIKWISYYKYYVQPNIENANKNHWSTITKQMALTTLSLMNNLILNEKISIKTDFIQLKEEQISQNRESIWKGLIIYKNEVTKSNSFKLSKSFINNKYDNNEKIIRNSTQQYYNLPLLK